MKAPDSRTTSLMLAIAIHVLLAGLLLLLSMGSGKTPPEKGIEVLFEPEFVTATASKTNAPGQPAPQKSPKPVEVVKAAKAPETSTSDLRTSPSTLSDDGDVEKPEPPAEKPINQRALFRSRDKGDSLAEQNSRRSANEMEAGHPAGNSATASESGSPAASLSGRSVVGSLPLPEYTVNKSGKVVVIIRVDQYGKVIGATAGAKGTTVQDKTLWQAATKAAFNARFNISGSAPAVQEGTITYIFNLR